MLKASGSGDTVVQEELLRQMAKSAGYDFATLRGDPMFKRPGSSWDMLTDIVCKKITEEIKFILRVVRDMKDGKNVSLVDMAKALGYEFRKRGGEDEFRRYDGVWFTLTVEDNQFIFDQISHVFYDYKR